MLEGDIHRHVLVAHGDPLLRHDLELVGGGPDDPRNLHRASDHTLGAIFEGHIGEACNQRGNTHRAFELTIGQVGLQDQAAACRDVEIESRLDAAGAEHQDVSPSAQPGTT